MLLFSAGSRCDPAGLGQCPLRARRQRLGPQVHSPNLLGCAGLGLLTPWLGFGISGSQTQELPRTVTFLRRYETFVIQ